MLSTLPKLADKAYILGFLLPAILFLLAIFFLFSDPPGVSDLSKQLMDVSNIEKLVYISATGWFLSIILMLANNILYQIVEGYRWPLSKVAWLRSSQMRRFEKKHRRINALEGEWKKAGDKFPARYRQEYDRLLIGLAKEFPSSSEFLLPTRFGNAIRAFEEYSRQIYGADSLRTERAQLFNERLAGLITPPGNDHLRALLGEGRTFDTLKHDGRDGIIRRLLADSGIELREPAKDGRATP